jgi:DNA (cytosine-5)-methyltransferase 1
VPPTLTKKEGQVSIKSVIGGLNPLRSGRSRGKEDSPPVWLKAIRDQVTDEMLNTVDENIRERMRSISRRRKTQQSRGDLFVPWDHISMSCEKELAKWIMDPRLGGICQHETRTHMDSDFARYLFASVYGEVNRVSPKLRHFPKSLLPLHKNVTEEKSGKRRNRDFHDRFRVQVAGSPASTIVSHIRRDGHYFIHYDPEQCRSLTVREVARLQTFPDNYYFEGNRTEQYQQVGNAVPPYLALQLAGVVAGLIKALNATDEPDDRQVRAASVPTASAP